MKKSLLYLILISSLIVSCKKKDDAPAPVTPAPSGPPADGSPSNATQFYGIFTSGNYMSMVGGGPPITSVMARAYFSNQAIAYMYSASSIKVNNVYLNNDSLAYNPVSKYYLPSYPVNLATETWSVNGANGIGSFNFTNNALQPSCSGYSNLPDSISKSVGFTVNINNVTNFTYGSLLVFDGTGNISGYYSVQLNAGDNVINVTPTNLSSVSTTTNGYMTIVLTNKSAYVFSGKDFQFCRESQYTKYIKIKP